MSEFHPISLSDKPLFDRALAAEPTQSSSVSFGNVYLWDLYCKRNVSDLGGRLGIEFLCPNGPFFAYPYGEGDLSEAIGALRDRALDEGRAFSLHGVTAADRKRLEDALPGRFSFEEDRDSFDYLYSVEAFASLSGKKLHAKRNFCNRFEAAGAWRFEELTGALFDDCRALLKRWDAEKDGGNTEENRAIERLFEQWDVLSMLGGVLYAGEAPAAFTIGEMLSPDTFDVHFEKADESVPGAYPMAARELARLLRIKHPGCRYLNREEDMGIPGLRRAKEEWYPLALLEKYTAVWKES